MERIKKCKGKETLQIVLLTFNKLHIISDLKSEPLRNWNMDICSFQTSYEILRQLLSYCFIKFEFLHLTCLLFCLLNTRFYNFASTFNITVNMSDQFCVHTENNDNNKAASELKQIDTMPMLNFHCYYTHHSCFYWVDN